MLKIKKNNNSLYLRDLPDGCKPCKKGQKMVLFVTGICPRKCSYCPLSDNKKDRDVVFADEWLTNREEDIIEECKLIKAKGAGITGGDPLSKLERTVKFIKLLKKNFGKKFHIHLYTSLNLVTKKSLKSLYDAGLDEIRFHPDLDYFKLWDKLSIAKEVSKEWEVGIEIPVIPGKEEQTLDLIYYSEEYIDFLNLNELEISDNNANSLTEQGFKTVENSYAIKKSAKMAKDILKILAKKNTKLKVHFCSTKVKDSEQLRERIKRRAISVKKNYDTITADGLLIRGAIYPIIEPEFSYREKIKKAITKENITKLKNIKFEIQKKYEIPNKYISIDELKLRILIAPFIIEELVKEKDFKYKAAIVTEYPTWDQLEIELEYLN